MVSNLALHIRCCTRVLRWYYFISYENLTTMTIFLYFSISFDIVNRNIARNKLYVHGIRGMANDWFRSLSARRQFLDVCGAASGCKEVNIGVLSGSILGRVHFHPFINYMCVVHQMFRNILILLMIQQCFFAVGSCKRGVGLGARCGVASAVWSCERGVGLRARCGDASAVWGCERVVGLRARCGVANREL